MDFIKNFDKEPYFCGEFINGKYQVKGDFICDLGTEIYDGETLLSSKTEEI